MKAKRDEYRVEGLKDKVPHAVQTYSLDLGDMLYELNMGSWVYVDLSDNAVAGSPGLQDRHIHWSISELRNTDRYKTVALNYIK